VWQAYVNNQLAMHDTTCARACDETNSRSAEELFATMMRDPSSDLLCEASFLKLKAICQVSLCFAIV
jgi:hypothetical protein